ncbi:AbfB domain-containing protein [Micromonospora sp. C51]|uniref:AbfB domain-containing protein n=1 Tax=Micromonospora sp. C51 TaxID=2824879 RepID=UPI001B388859|nr:AbfB domain-containing protein [Micromonospora sp. C51]MBQ1050759.1 AbfB domain-containing protein [Micromonospora sp. C51]
MSQNGNGRSHLRIGGWLPGTSRPASGSDHWGTGTRHQLGRARRTTPSPPSTGIAPSTVPYPGGYAGRTIDAYPVTEEPVHEYARDAASTAATGNQGATIGRAGPRRTQVLGGVALVVVTAVVGVMALRDGTPQEPIRGEFVAGLPLPDGAADDPAIDPLPDTDGTGSRGDGPATQSPTTDPVVRPGLNPRADGSDADEAGSTGLGSPPASPATKNPPPAPNAPASPAKPAGPALVPGARIGLEAASSPGHRVRHANFEARVDPVNVGTRADAAFIVRSGLANGNCVSFESVNFPGHYLRHADFRVFLHRTDGSALFRADATFCPVTGIGGRHTSLRSHNFPDRYLSHDRHQQMRISPIGAGAGPSTATFRIRPAG